MGGLLHLVQRGEIARGCSPPRSLFAVPNVTAHTSTTSVPITVLLYNGPFFCGFNVPIKGLSTAVMSVVRDVDQMSPSVAHSEVVIHFMPLRNLDTGIYSNRTAILYNRLHTGKRQLAYIILQYS